MPNARITKGVRVCEDGPLPEWEESKRLVKGLLNTAAGAALSQWPLCNDMVRKCFLWPAARETTLTSDIKADATFIDVNAITTDMTEVLKYVLVLNFKKMYS